MKIIITIIFLITSMKLISQIQYQNSNGYLKKNKDTVAYVLNYSKDLEKRLLKEEKLDVNVIPLKKLTDKEKKELEYVIFYPLCRVIWIDSLEIKTKEIDNIGKVSKFSDSLQTTESILLNRISVIEKQNENLRLKLELSSNYLIKSGNQKNLSICIGIGGSLISSGLIILNSYMGYTPSEKPIGSIIGIASSAAFLTLQITSNINLKKAGSFK
jgi:hypothetical protein